MIVENGDCEVCMYKDSEDGSHCWIEGAYMLDICDFVPADYKVNKEMLNDRQL